MRATRILFASINFPVHVEARAVRGPFASTCHFAATVLFRVALLLIFGAAVHAQTAHLSSVQSILSLPSALNFPQAVAVDGSGDIFVADAYNSRVLKLTPSVGGGYAQSTVGTGLKTPYGVAVDASGNVYIADIFLTTLLMETPSGNSYVQSTIGNQLYDAVSVAVDKQGNVYGVEINNSFIGTMFKETLSSGTYTQSFIPVPGTHGVDSVAVDGNGNLFVNDGWDGGQIYELSPVGNNLYTTTEFLSQGGAIAIDGNNDIYIANYPGSIVKLTPNGGTYTESEIPTNATNTPYGYFDAAGLAVDQNGNIYFTDLYTYSLIEESLTSGNFGSVSVGYSSYPVSMFFTFDTSGFMQSAAVSTQGAAALDFTDAGTGDCYPASYGADWSCWIDVVFTPSAAGVRSGAATLFDSNGNSIATGYVQGTGVAPLVNFSPGTAISEIIGSDGSAVAVDAKGNLYTVAPGRSTAFEDMPAGGAGNWTETQVGGELGSATGIAIDGAGDLYIADQANREIVKETFTLNGYLQSVIASQSNGLNGPTGVAVDESGNVYVTDPGVSNGVFKETPSVGGYVQSVIPTSTLSQPGGIAVDSIGSVYIADTNNDRVLKETPSGASYTESTIGAGASSPTAVAVDGFGNVYVSENSAGVVLKETLVAGSYVQSTMASGLQPYGLAVDGSLNLYIAGSSSRPLVKLDVSDGPGLSFANTEVGQVSSDSPKTITFSNAGNAPLTLPIGNDGNNPSLGGSYLLGTSGGNDCPVVTPSSSLPGTLAAGASCLLSVSFSPLSPGANPSTLTIWDNNLNAPAPNYTSQSLQLQGTAAGSAALISPTPGSTLTGSSATFTWTAGEGVSAYEFRLGTTGPGSTNLYNSAEATTTALSSGPVSNIPTNGAMLYARLYSRINGAWQYTDYTYTEIGTPIPAALTAPTPGSTLTGSSASFTWSAGVDVTLYEFRLGTTGPGSSNVYNSAGATTTALSSGLVSNIPTNDAKLYARLYSRINGAWQYNDYTYTEFGTPVPAALTAPTAGSTLTGSSATFTWSAGVDVTLYEFRLGTTGPGSTNVYNSAEATTTALTSGLVSNIPANAATLYARLYSRINGAWQYNDYTYTEFGTPAPAVLLTPTPGSTLTGSSATFTWSAGVDVTLYEFRLGTTGPGSSNVYNSAEATTSALSSGLVSNIPTNGVKLYARLYSRINGAWQYSDYTYKESSTP